MKTYVINLRRATTRKSLMVKQGRALGITLDFIQAVDGLDITDEDRALVDNFQRQKFTRYVLTDGEIGCWLSHRKAMQALLDSGDDMAAILEDDVTLSADFMQLCLQ